MIDLDRQELAIGCKGDVERITAEVVLPKLGAIRYAPQAYHAV